MYPGVARRWSRRYVVWYSRRPCIVRRKILPFSDGFVEFPNVLRENTYRLKQDWDMSTGNFLFFREKKRKKVPRDIQTFFAFTVE